MNIQIYALKRNFDVQKAERFFKERRIPYQTVDLKKHRLGRKELILFAGKAGAKALIVRNDDSLSHPICYSDDPDYIFDSLAEHPEFLVTPIVRNGSRVTLGADEITWKQWIEAEQKK